MVDLAPRFLDILPASDNPKTPNQTLPETNFVLYNASIMHYQIRFANNNNNNDDLGIVGRSLAN